MKSVEDFLLVCAFGFSGSCYLLCIAYKKVCEIYDIVRKIREDQNWQYFHGKDEK